MSLVVPSLVVLRLLLSFSPLPRLLEYNHQLSSPLTSYSRLQEGLFLLDHSIDPYAGGLFRHSPILLAVFSTILPLSPTFSPILWTFFDVFGSWCLVKIWQERSQTRDLHRDNLVAASYLLNPYLVLSTLALSTSTFDNAFTLLTILFASQGRRSASLLTLAFLGHSSLPSILLLPPLILLLLSTPKSSLAKPHLFSGSYLKSILFALEFSVYFGILALISTLISDGTGWIKQTWGAVVLLPDLTPNPGVWWYFFTEMFDHYRPFFLMSFSVHLVSYIAPMCLKFQHDPLYATFLLQGVLATFKSYPTLADSGLFVSMISLFPETYPYLRHPLPSTFLHLYASLLQPLFHNLWLNQGTGNANFYYATTLVFGLANGGTLIDSMWAGLRLPFGEKVYGKEVVQI